MDSTAVVPFSAERAVNTTSAFFKLNTLAASRPMPLFPPVIKMVLPVWSVMLSIVQFFVDMSFIF